MKRQNQIGCTSGIVLLLMLLACLCTGNAFADEGAEYLGAVHAFTDTAKRKNLTIHHHSSSTIQHGRVGLASTTYGMVEYSPSKRLRS